MPANEAVTEIESAAQYQGIEEAYDVLKSQMEEIQASMPGREADIHLAQMTEQLRQDGLLPDLAIQFAFKERYEIEQDGTFDRDHLRLYRKGADPLTRAMTSHLLENFDALREGHGDLFWHELSEQDLRNAATKLQDKTYAFDLDFSAEGSASGEIANKEKADGNWLTQIGDKIGDMARQHAEAEFRRKNPSVEVKPGDGFDRIARRVLEQTQDKVAEADVIEYSRRLAEYNQKDRNTSVLHPGDRLHLPPPERD